MGWHNESLMPESKHSKGLQRAASGQEEAITLLSPFDKGESKTSFRAGPGRLSVIVPRRPLIQPSPPRGEGKKRFSSF